MTIKHQKWRRKGDAFAAAYFALGCVAALFSGSAFAFTALICGLISGAFIGVLLLDEDLENDQ